MLSITHSADMDGICCAAILKYKYPDIELIGYDYGQKFPWEKIQGQDVIMADVSLQPFSDMVKLSKEAKSLIWIDHHKSAIQNAELCCFRPLGVRGIKQAACELLWEFLYSCEPPRAVYLLGRYDVWDHKDPDVLPFQYGMKINDTDPNHQELWSGLLEDVFLPCDPEGHPETLVEHIVYAGHNLLKYQKQEDARYCKTVAFETELCGLKLIAINKGLTNSKVFDSVWNPNKYDAMCCFVWKDGLWKFSLYTDKDNIDILSVSKSYSGGGHPKANGFQLKELPEGFLK